jgi:Tfp pilus assembly protein PilZ
METTSIQDRRTFDRFSARFPAKFKDARDDYGTNVYLRDASAEGARVTTRERLYLNDTVTLEVEIPDGHAPMNIRGEVIWMKSREPQVWDVGLKFHNVSLMHLSRIYEAATTD